MQERKPQKAMKMTGRPSWRKEIWERASVGAADLGFFECVDGSRDDWRMPLLLQTY